MISISKPPRNPKTLKERHLDAAFSLLVRMRANFRCERCSNTGVKMDCSHLFGRRNRSTRFDPDNAVCHCATCHRHLTENPMVFAEWIHGYLGPDRAAKLRLRVNTPIKRTTSQKRDLYNRMLSEIDRITDIRSNRVTKREEFYL